MQLKMSVLYPSLQIARATLKNNLSPQMQISVAKLVIDEGGVEPRNADARANADGQFIIPIRNDGFLTASDVTVYLEADEFGNTVYPEQEVTITVPINGVTRVIRLLRPAS